MDDRQRNSGGGVKVTYIETQFVTSDAAGFKDLVQRLTGRSAPTGGAGAGAKLTLPPHKPRACRVDGARTAAAAAGAGVESCYYYRQAADQVGPAVASCSTPCQDDLLLDADFFSDLFDVGVGEQQCHGLNGGYSDFPAYYY